MNRKKNIKYEDQEFADNHTDYFISDSEKSVERLTMSKVIAKKYKEKEEINTMEKLIEQDNESSSDEYNDESISNINDTNKTEINRSTERSYESHFRLTNINNSKRYNQNDEVESKVD